MFSPFIGEVVLYPYSFAPFNWVSCAGQLLQVSQNTALAQLLGNKFGGDGKQTFGLPNYQSVTPNDMMEYCIALTGIYPGGNRRAAIGEISLLPYEAPSGWFECNGQLLTKADFPQLFQVIGTTFGGDGESTFAVPDLISTPPPMPSQSIYCISAFGAPVPLEPFLGELRLLPYPSAPNGWSACQGQLFAIQDDRSLFDLIGTRFGGDGRDDFALPDLSNAEVPSGLQYFIALKGVFPQRN
jgi:microcystin-dependent protein